MLYFLAPDHGHAIYDEVKSESNTYGRSEELERLCRVNRLLMRGVEPEIVLNAVKQHNEQYLDLLYIHKLCEVRP